MSILNQLAEFYKTDKAGTMHNYAVKYEKYLPFNRYDNLKILEIGVLRGESVKMWKDYFYRSQIIGVDIDSNCQQYEEERINIEIGSQIDDDFLKRVSNKYGPFDMILDDGSHMNSHQIFSFEHLFKTINSGGVYIVEDCCTSYWEEYDGGRYKKGTAIEYFKGVVDEVNFFGELSEAPGGGVHHRNEQPLIEQFRKKGYNYIGTQIESLNFLNGIILITKR